MTHPRNPDDLGPDAFDGLGLESLTEGAHATSAQWSAIATDAGRRRQRRSWIVAAAALVVLVVGCAGVLVSRSGDDGVEIVMGGALPGAERFVIPPDDASDVIVNREGASYQFTYTRDDRSWQLMATSPDAPGMSGLEGVDVAADASALSGGRAIPSDQFGAVYTACAGWWSSADEPGSTATTVMAFAGPPISLWMMDGWLTRLMPNDVLGHGPPCDLSEGTTDELERETDDLRPATREEFDAYVATLLHPEADGMAEMTTTTSTTSTSTTTTPTEVDAPPDPRSAEEQIAEAVGDWQRRDAAGSFVYLEDGTEKAAEYAEMFDLAARQSGADQDDGSVEDTAEVSRLEFVTPERARFTIEFTSTLPTGQYTFGQQGEAIVEDGRWVITYRTVTSTLGRACLPPGGYDGCP